MFGENAGVCGCVQVCVGVHRHVWVCSVVYEYAWVCMSLRVCASGVWVYMGICGCTRECLDVPGCAWVCLGACVWDEFSEYLLET